MNAFVSHVRLANDTYPLHDIGALRTVSLKPDIDYTTEMAEIHRDFADPSDIRDTGHIGGSAGLYTTIAHGGPTISMQNPTVVAVVPSLPMTPVAHTQFGTAFQDSTFINVRRVDTGVTGVMHPGGFAVTEIMANGEPLRNISATFTTGAAAFMPNVEVNVNILIGGILSLDGQSATRTAVAELNGVPVILSSFRMELIEDGGVSNLEISPLNFRVRGNAVGNWHRRFFAGYEYAINLNVPIGEADFVSVDAEIPVRYYSGGNASEFFDVNYGGVAPMKRLGEYEAHKSTDFYGRIFKTATRVKITPSEIRYCLDDIQSFGNFLLGDANVEKDFNVKYVDVTSSSG